MIARPTAQTTRGEWIEWTADVEVLECDPQQGLALDIPEPVPGGTGMF